MATKPTLPTLTNSGNVQSQITTMNAAYRTIENEFEKMLSREDNSLPNEMHAAIDLNGHKLLNVAQGTAASDGVTKAQLDTKEDLLGNPLTDGQVLASMADGTRYWATSTSNPNFGGIAVGVDDLNSTNYLTFWKGTQAEYDALTPTSTTVYFIV